MLLTTSQTTMIDNVSPASSAILAVVCGDRKDDSCNEVAVRDVGSNFPSSLCTSSSPAMKQKSAADRNEERCQQILECKRQIFFWKSKLEILQKERERCLKLQRLKLDPSGTWRALSRSERHDKEYILTALSSSSSSECQLPPDLDDFPNVCSFPTYLRHDRDLFLARIARDDVEEKYNNGTGGGRLFIPPNLRGDKAVILAVLPRIPTVLENMACELRDDDEVFEAVLDLVKKVSSCTTSSVQLPANFLQHFSTRIRSSRSHMIRLCRHHAGLSSMGFVSQALRNDKRFLIDAIRGVSPSNASTHDWEKKRILSYASPRLRDDKDVVIAAVQLCGLNLKHASSDLRRDPEVVMEAVYQCPTSFRFVLPGELKSELLHNRGFVLDHLLKSSSISRSAFRACVEIFSDDREVVLKAISCISEGLDWGGVPRFFRNDRQFIKDALSQNPKVFLSLPVQFRTDFEIAFHACQIIGVDGDTLLEATEQCPSLLSDRSTIVSISKTWQTDVLYETLQYVPIEIRSDKEIMIEVVSNDPSALSYCSHELQNDRDVVLAAIEACPRDAHACLLDITDTFQRDNPDIVVRIIESSQSQHSHLYRDISEDLWTHRDVALAWLSNGGKWLSEDFPGHFQNDKELMLAVVRSDWDDFDYASYDLKNDKQFMLQAIGVDGRVIRDIGESLRHDEDIALLAFSKSIHAVQFYSSGSDFEFMVRLTCKVRRKLDEYDNFQSLIFANTAEPEKNPGSPLVLLNQGPDSVQHFVKLFAAYVGLPSRKELSLLREASRNLLSWGF